MVMHLEAYGIAVWSQWIIKAVRIVFKILKENPEVHVGM
jgi:hypothetical protein